MYLYMYLPKCELYLYLYPYPSPSLFLSRPTYLPTYQAFLHRSPFLIPPSPSRARARMYVYIYELMEGFSSLSYPVRTSPRPSAPLPPKKKKETLNRSLRFGGFAPPPSPCDGSSHIQSQLDKAGQGKTRQDKASYLPAKELRKK